MGFFGKSNTERAIERLHDDMAVLRRELCALRSEHEEVKRLLRIAPAPPHPQGLKQYTQEEWDKRTAPAPYSWVDVQRQSMAAQQNMNPYGLMGAQFWRP